MESFPARYNDGRSAKRFDVDVGLEPEGLSIKGMGVTAFWPYDRIVALDEAFRGAPFRLAIDGGEARLTCEREDVPSNLFDLAPRTARARKKSRWKGSAKVLTGMVAAVIVLTLFLVVALPKLSRWSAMLVPVSWEVAIGEAVFGQIVTLLSTVSDKDRLEVCVAPNGAAALATITDRLGDVVESPYRFKFHVLDHGMVNAFALPGGTIVVFRGLIEFVDSPDELAGIIAHEMGHVVERHSMEKLMEQLGLGFFFGMLLGDVSTGAVALSGEVLLSLSFSRQAEGEADDLALEYLGRAGLDARPLGDFFSRLQALYGSAGDWPRIVSTHPPSGERASKFRNAPAGDNALSAADWLALRGICRERAPAPS